MKLNDIKLLSVCSVFSLMTFSDVNAMDILQARGQRQLARAAAPADTTEVAALRGARRAPAGVVDGARDVDLERIDLQTFFNEVCNVVDLGREVNLEEKDVLVEKIRKWKATAAVREKQQTFFDNPDAGWGRASIVPNDLWKKDFGTHLKDVLKADDDHAKLGAMNTLMKDLTAESGAADTDGAELEGVASDARLHAIYKLLLSRDRDDAGSDENEWIYVAVLSCVKDMLMEYIAGPHEAESEEGSSSESSDMFRDIPPTHSGE